MMWRRMLFLALVSVAAPASGQAVPVTRDSLLVSATWLEAHLRDPNLVVLQVERDPNAFVDGHIPGARLVPMGAIVVTRDGLPALGQLDSVLEAAGVSSDSRVILYGDPLATGRLFFTLDYLGMAGRAALLDGGLSAWRSGGRPLTREVPPPGSGRFEARVQSGLIVDADWIARRLDDSSLALLDARAPAEYAGQTPGDGVPRAGHIPGAGSAFWRMLLNGADPVTLKEPDILRALLGRAGMLPGREIVTYCRTGVQASYLYFVARYLGYAPRLYDGSFIDWSRHPELPVSLP
jgi:thiosulfate/3-mercaptopyruvate sulfurtransferase